MNHLNTSATFRAGAAALVIFLTSASPASGRGGPLHCPVPADEFVPRSNTTSEFLISNCTFDSEGENPFFLLRPGYRAVLESEEERAVITVLDETKEVDGVTTRVVEEFESVLDDGEWVVVERSLNYFALCRETNSVFYFGEDVEIFEEDGSVTHEGAWLAGRNGARPGVVMPGTPLVGGRYYEEIAPEDSAIDKARVRWVRTGCRTDVFDFADRVCLKTAGSTDCNNDTDEKVYAEGVGLIRDEDLRLVDFGFIGD